VEENGGNGDEPEEVDLRMILGDLAEQYWETLNSERKSW